MAGNTNFSTKISNLPSAEALKYLVQRISTTLWFFSAKMLMQRLATFKFNLFFYSYTVFIIIIIIDSSISLL